MDKNKFAEAMKYLFRAKGKETNTEMMAVWYEALNNYPENNVLDAMKKLALNSKEFINVGMVIELMGEDDNHRIEKEWAEVLAFKRMGDSKMSLKSKLVMKNLGGMNWLWDSMKNEVDFKKRNFIEAWKNTPDPRDNNFRCQGIEDNRVYIVENNTKQIEG